MTTLSSEKKRIEFIKENPTFFQIYSRSRAQILGIEKHDSSQRLGEGVIVGVIDGFEECQQTSKILHQATNPNFRGEVSFKGLSLDEKNHGLHVAGIIVSDSIDQNDFP